ncbi:hypothetical protein D908_00824 [Vibrio mimicus CAIM 602]|nr:hypothetical protein D908_00824 [Vibrio mimicus CAIM 602]
MMKPLVNQAASVEHPAMLKHRGLLVFSDFGNAQHSTLSIKAAST